MNSTEKLNQHWLTEMGTFSGIPPKIVGSDSEKVSAECDKRVRFGETERSIFKGLS